MKKIDCEYTISVGTNISSLKGLEYYFNGLITYGAITEIDFFQNSSVTGVLETDENYSVPYEPLYDGSPATKKYVDERSVKVLEASTDNVIDFHTLTEDGVYLIKNCATDTTLNAPELSSLTSVGATSCDITLEVLSCYNTSGDIVRIEQNARYLLRLYKARTYNVSSTTWSVWDSGISPSEISAGTLSGKVSANATAVTTLTNPQVRNITASTTDLTAGTSTLATGDIVFVYE